MGRMIDDGKIPYFMQEDGTVVAYKADIEQIPSAQPEQQWIPCSERLPEEGIVLVTYRDRDIDILRYPTAYRQYDIIAWMPIEPWRGEEHGQDD